MADADVDNVSSSSTASGDASIEKVGAAIVRDGKVLVVRKEGQPSVEFFMAGGKIEPGESRRAALTRELREELDVQVTEARYLGSFRDIAVFESVPIVIHAYHVEISGEPRPSGEITEVRWIDRADVPDAPLSSIMAQCVLPALARAGVF